MPFGKIIVYVGGGLLGLYGIINNSSNNNKNRNIEVKEYTLAEKSIFYIEDDDEKIKGNYNIISNEKNFIIKNMNFVFKNNKNDTFIINNNNKWVIIDNNDNVLYESLKKSFLFPEGIFINKNNKKINLNILNQSLINKYKKLQNDYNLYNIKIDDNINNLLNNKNNIFLKSKIVSDSDINCSVYIKNSHNPKINGLYKSTNTQNKYGLIFKHVNNNYWLGKAISLNKEKFNTKYVWCLSDESPIEGIYYKNIIYFSNDDILRIPENNMYDINNNIIDLKSSF